ncbi:hypothetical protein MP638_000786 [Amoeboaphelidium occidentale]|nr:hypothetical protein MP638_000786 [Amoeboaphelidium occidentale]
MLIRSAIGAFSKQIKPTATLAEVVAAVNQSNQKLESIDQRVKSTNELLGGFIGNQASLTEEEVVKAVCKFLQVDFKKVTMNFKICDSTNTRVLVEVDGLIPCPNSFAVVEAKSTVQGSSLVQLQKSMNLVALYFGKKVIGFLGGPLFKGDVKSEALRDDISIVKLSGDRYVVKSDNIQSKRAVTG